MLAVAFAPHPPALVPELCGGPVGELTDVREFCSAAVTRLVATQPELVWIVGGGPSQRWYGTGDVASLAPFGRPVDLPFAGPPGVAASRPPLSLTIGTWLLDQAGYDGDRRGLAVPADSTDPQLDDLAAELVGAAGLLVMADGSARRDAEAAGTSHPGALPFDDAVAAALAGGDAAALAALDPRVAAQVQAQGAASWRLAGHRLRDARVHADLLYYGAPLGVGYTVAVWTPA